MEKNIIPHTYRISPEDRRNQNQHNSFLIWFTGLSGSGKSTLANELEVRLHNLGIRTFTLDGDNVRSGINKGLNFTPEGRRENLRRVAEIAKLFIDAGIVTLAAFVSPTREVRDYIKSIVGPDNYVEVYVNTSLEECERRDVKGLYAKARRGEIENFTGLSAPYEAPLNPDIEIRTEQLTVKQAVDTIVNALEEKLNIE